MKTTHIDRGATRREVLKTLGWAGIAGLQAPSVLARQRRTTLDYNILWLMADEHNPFVAGYAGDKRVLTPALDSIAGTAFQFTAAYTPDPICVPSRQAFHSGRMASNIDFANTNYESMGPYFTRMGFSTAWFGKQHWGNLNNTYTHEGESCGDVVKQRFADAGLEFPKGTRLVADANLSYWGPNLNEDTVATEQALAFLDQVGDQPFFMGVSYVKPHFPFTIQNEYYAPYAAKHLPRPKVTQAMLDDLSTAMKSDRITFGIDQLTVEQSDFGRAVYYGMISYMDAQVSQVLAKLDALNLRDKTIVVYMADHGEMMGQHGIWYKNAFFEGSARVPMLISLPASFSAWLPTRIDAPANSIDLFPTLCELCGLPPPPTLEGRSLVPLMSGADMGLDRVAFSENKRRGIAARMIRTRQFKYCYYEDGVEQMYDMTGHDRNVEGTNLAPDPAYAKRKAHLKKQALDGWNPDGLFDDDD
jgi:choline-sulfatase